jgi:molybdate-binding protein/DNA-binding XRE family transcriptional regulator
VPGADLVNHVRVHRSQAGLSQAELAERVGVSRQSLAAVEAGRQVPSTSVSLQLARVLRCSVEDLFALPTGPRVRAALVSATTNRRVVLGRVDGAWVAHPVDTSDRLADGVLVGDSSRPGAVEVEPLRDLKEHEHNVLIAGCAPLLGVLAGCLRRRGDPRGAWVRADSTRSLELLARGSVHVAGLHLADTSSAHGHRELVRERFPGQEMIIIGLARWRQGIAVSPGNPLAIRRIEDTQRKGVRFVRRAPGSGAHRLVERLLAEAGVSPAPPGPQLEASGHAEVARLIRLGVADAGVVFEGAARGEGLDFIPLAQERFDLVLPRDRLAQRPVADALSVLEHREFRMQASWLTGYDLATTGESETVAAA